MSETLHIVATTLLSALGLAFMIWLYFYTLKRSYDPALILFKELLTVAMVAGEIYGSVAQFAGKKHKEQGMC